MPDDLMRSDAPRIYNGRFYKPNSGDFEVVSLRVEGHSLVASTGEGDQNYDLCDLNLDLTGQEGDKIRLTHVPTGASILCTDKHLLEDLQQHGGHGEIGRVAKKAHRDLRSLPMRNAVIILVILGAIALTIASLVFGFDPLVNLAMKNIPPSAEESIGKMYADDEKLDNRSEEWTRIDRIGQKLVSKLKNNPYKFRFYIEDKDEINAYALPGGTIVVLSKLVKDAKSDDEIACVMGHEIGHVIHRDTLRRLLHTGGFGLTLAIISGGMISNEQIKAFIPALQKLESLNFSRKQEAAADKAGIRLTVLSGYDGAAMIQFFQRLEKERPQVVKDALAILSDHPMSEDRIEMIRVENAKAKALVKEGKDPDLDKD
jgi:Zn-dependent protease with chaperone function